MSGYYFYINNFVQIFHRKKFIGWGRKRTGKCAFYLHKKFSGSLVLLEDGFLRSLNLGVENSPSFSIVKDDVGIYYDAMTPSKLENILNIYEFSTEELEQAKKAIELIKKEKLSKYNNNLCVLKELFSVNEERVLIITQVANDASLKFGLADNFSTQDIINDAIKENPNAKIYIKIHPDVLSGKKQSDFDMQDLPSKCVVIKENYNPIELLSHFKKVYTKTSGMGFEALMLKRECVCYGMPFYAGWGLTQDKQACKRRLKKRTLEEVFYATYILYSEYFNPYLNQKSDIFDTIHTLAKYKKIEQANSNTLYFLGFSKWKREFVRPFFEAKNNKIIFLNSPGELYKANLNPEDKIFIWGKKYDKALLAKDFKFKTFSSTFKNMAFASFLYWLFAFLFSWYFNNSLHHRSLKLFDFLPWFCSVYRKNKYKITEKSLNEKILSLKQKYFLAILQVHNDTQLSHHYKKTTEKFIEEVIISFANHAKAKSYLVFKHHPMDRGYRDYTKLIEDLSLKYNVEGRILYVHDLHLPTLLINARGTIVINSTVGLSALYHNSPLKVMGKAFYDIEGLTYQKSLHTFWKECRAYKPDAVLHAKFRNYVIYKTQVNGNFFKNTSLD
ncbi:capsular polysaccharide export protein KpsC [Campylobacter lari]|nr:capsular polysaccharide export protein KpsC [Campylobacter lari]